MGSIQESQPGSMPGDDVAKSDKYQNQKKESKTETDQWERDKEAPKEAPKTGG